MGNGEMLLSGRLSAPSSTRLELRPPLPSASLHWGRVAFWLFVSRQIVGMREGGRPWVFEPDQRISLMMQQQQQVA